MIRSLGLRYACKNQEIYSELTNKDKHFLDRPKHFSFQNTTFFFSIRTQLRERCEVQTRTKDVRKIDLSTF